MRRRSHVQHAATATLSLFITAGAFAGSAGCDWNAQNVQTPDITQDIRAIEMFDAQQGIAVGDVGQAWITSDGGQTWSIVPTGVGAYCLTILEPNFAFVGGRYSQCAVSFDRGQTWQTRTNPTPSGRLVAADFVSPDVGWVITDGAGFYKTTDGGNSWTALDPEPNHSYVRTDVDFINENEGWLIGPRQLSWHSTDGGQTWQRQYPPAHANPVSSGTPTGIHMVNENVGWIVGDRAYVCYTMDGGAHWLLQDPDLPIDFAPYFLEPVSEREAWMLHLNGEVRHTTDGGATWQSESTGFEGTLFNGFWDIEVLPDAGVWLSGDDETIVFRDRAPLNAADLNNDCAVTDHDVCLWRLDPVDVNGDGSVDDADRAAIAAQAGPFDDCNDDGFPDSCEQAQLYRIDRGIIGSIIFPSPSHPYGGDQILINKFVVRPDAPPAGDVLTHVDFTWGFEMGGRTITIAVWSDPNDDGQLEDAVLEASAQFVGPPDSYQDVQRLDIPDVNVGQPGEIFYVGAAIPWDDSSGIIVPRSDAGMRASWHVVGDNINDLDANTEIFFNDSSEFLIRALTTGLVDADGDGSYDNCDWVPGSQPVPGDINGDNVVDVLDLFVLLNNWGSCAAPCPSDLTGDGMVDVNDLFDLLSSWS